MTSDTPLPPIRDGWPVFEPGWVWLVGAGPGDPGLLTLHGLSALRQADVVVYDALVNTDLLSFVGPATLVEYAGKRGGKPSPKQRDISLRLVDLARSGKRVLRLKGGDPFVFGRGAEEAGALVDAGVPFRIVPGISAGIGGLAYAGIPITHRDVNQTVTFLTGHDQTGLTPQSINWKGVAEGSPVIVMYMAIKHLSAIADKLIEAGRGPEEPVAVVSSASTPEQRVLETTLGSAAEDCARDGVGAPAIVCLGAVVEMRRTLDWLAALDGRMLVPRADGKVADTAP